MIIIMVTSLITFVIESQHELNMFIEKFAKPLYEKH